MLLSQLSAVAVVNIIFQDQRAEQEQKLYRTALKTKTFTPEKNVISSVASSS